MATIDDLRKRYTVGLAFDGTDGVAVYSVSAPGLQTYVRGDDTAAIEALANPPAPEPARVPEPVKPDAATSVLFALGGLDADTASVKDVVDAVKAALLAATG